MKASHLTEAKRWLKQAAHDFEVAQKHHKDAFWSDCCFVAQQAAEKALKGYLFYKGIRPGTQTVFTHSVTELVKYCRRIDVSFPDIAGVKDLDKYYIPTRYPDAFPGEVPYEMYEEKDAVMALKISKNILEKVEKRINK